MCILLPKIANNSFGQSNTREVYHFEHVQSLLPLHTTVDSITQFDSSVTIIPRILAEHSGTSPTIATYLVLLMSEVLEASLFLLLSGEQFTHNYFHSK